LLPKYFSLFSKMIQKMFFFLLDKTQSVAVLFFFFSRVQNEWMWVEEWVDSSMLKSRWNWLRHVDLIIFTKMYVTTIAEIVHHDQTHFWGNELSSFSYWRSSYLLSPVESSSSIFYRPMYSSLHCLILKLAYCRKNVQNSVVFSNERS
jgi:hypothetical protein